MTASHLVRPRPGVGGTHSSRSASRPPSPSGEGTRSGGPDAHSQTPTASQQKKDAVA